MLDTPEKRRAVALALADRKHRADLRMNAAGDYTPKVALEVDSNDHAQVMRAKNSVADKTQRHNNRVQTQAGYDGAFYPSSTYLRKGGVEHYYKTKDGRLVKASGMDYKSQLSKDDPRRCYVDHHYHGFCGADGKPLYDAGEKTDDEDRPYRAKLKVKVGSLGVPLKVSPKYDPKTGETQSDSDDNIRSNGWATGRYRDKIRDKLAAKEHDDSVYFAARDSKRDQVDKEYQTRHNRDNDTMKKIGDIADASDFGSVHHNMIKKAKLRNDRIRKIMNPDSSDGEEKKKGVK